MSQENVDIVRRVRGRGAKAEAGLRHPDHVLRSMLSAVDGRDFVGASGFREWLADMGATWGSWEGTVAEVEAIDRDRVLFTTVTALEAAGLRGR